jgi:putative addiction module antidote
MHKLKITKVGNSAAVILPKNVLEDLGAQVGDEVIYAKLNNGISITRDDSKFSAYVETAREIMRDYDLTMRELAK